MKLLGLERGCTLLSRPAFFHNLCQVEPHRSIMPSFFHSYEPHRHPHSARKSCSFAYIKSFGYAFAPLYQAWLNRVPADVESHEMTLFLKFVRTLEGLTAFRTEWTIYGEGERLAGSIDFVAEDKHGNLVIFDWKRSKERMSVALQVVCIP